MKLLFALTINSATAPTAERLLDFIHHRDGKHGDILLGMYAGVHDEMKARIRISAGLAFNNVHEIEIRPLADPKAPPFAHINSAFRQVAVHIDDNMTWPFMWLETTSTPVAPRWRQRIWEAYESQPYPFMGNRMLKPKTEKTPDIYFMARVGVYPNNTATLFPDRPEMPFEMANSKTIDGRLGVTKLIQTMRINSEADLISVRDNAILVSGDNEGLLLKQVAESPEPESEPVKIEVGTGHYLNGDKVCAKPSTLNPVDVSPRMSRKTMDMLKANGVKP